MFEPPGFIRELREQDWTKSLIAKLVVYSVTTVALVLIVIIFAPSRFPRDLETPPASRIEAEVIAATQKTATLESADGQVVRRHIDHVVADVVSGVLTPQDGFEDDDDDDE